MFHKARVASAAIAASALIAGLTGVAVADDVLVDSDVIQAGIQGTGALTGVPGGTATGYVSFTLKCDGKNHVDSGQTVNLARHAAELDGTPVGSPVVSATTSTVGAVTSAWPDDTTGSGQTNCAATPQTMEDNGNSTVTVHIPADISLGDHAVTVTYLPTLSPAGAGDPQAVSGNRTAAFTLTVLADGDGDLVADVDDNCPAVANADQADTDTDGTGDACEAPVATDMTPPEISYVLNPATADGANGWYRSNVTLTWTVTENESPTSLVKTGCVDQNITADQVKTTYSCSATSDGGSAAQVDVQIGRDAAKPSVDITSPAGPSTLLSSVTVSGTQSDATSGVAGVQIGLTSATLSNGTFSASNVALECGGNTVTATATDRAGNTESDSLQLHRVCFTGSFQQPLDGNGVLNKAKFGRVVPVKIVVSANDGTTSPEAVYFGYRSVPCSTGAGTDEVESYMAAGSSNAGNTFRLADGVWIYNLDTTKLPGATVGSCYQLDVYAGGTVNPTTGIASGGVPVANGSVRISLTK